MNSEVSSIPFPHLINNHRMISKLDILFAGGTSPNVSLVYGSTTPQAT